MLLYTEPAMLWDSIRESLHTLLEFACTASAAKGFLLCECNAAGALTVRDRGGSPVAMPKSLISARKTVVRDGMADVSYPIRGEEAIHAVLAFAFDASAIGEENLAMLDRLCSIIESVYRLPFLTHRTVAKVCGLELELVNLKISERTRGLLANGGPASESVQLVVRHVETVLKRRRLVNLLEENLVDLQDQVAERKLFAKAKHLLQSRDGVSEEQAYLQLIHQSRNTRKRLGDLAKEVMDLIAEDANR